MKLVVNNMDDDTPMASRSGQSNPLGKCTELAKTMLPPSVKEGLRRKAFDMGLSEQEYLRELIMVDVFGVDMVLKLHEDRLSRFTTMGTGKGPKE